jgi:UDP-2,3-diacylglucosamine hydrolase
LSTPRPATEVIFFSDLHLSPARTGKLRLFQRLLRGPGRNAQSLYLLGDLFDEFWAGNDDRTPPNAEILAALRDCAAAGPKCHILRGNRDLMLDAGFTAQTGWQLLPDKNVIPVFGEPVLIMHGDLLCTRDTGYQAFRAFLEYPWIRRLYLALPCALRILLSHGLRPLLRRSAAGKPPEIIDVEPGAVRREMEHAGVAKLIHGHTHRPGTFPVALAGQTGSRVVLGDWYGDGQILVCTAEQWRLITVEDYLRERGTD